MRQMLIVVMLSLSLSPALAYQGSEPVPPTETPQPITANPDLTLLWQQVRRQPEDFAVGCVPLSDTSRAFYYNADERFPLASVGKLLTYIEFARRVNRNEIFWGEPVPVATLNQYDLTRTDGGAHQRFLDIYPAGTSEVSRWDIATDGMMQYSSNAASDFTLAEMQPVDWAGLYGTLGLTNTDAPHPLVQIPLMMGNHDTGRLDMTAALAPTLYSDGEAWVEQFISDATWHNAELAYRQQRRRGFPDWDVQSVVLQEHTMTGTVEDMVAAMLAVYSEGSPLAPNTRNMVRDALRWEESPNVNLTYIEYGSKLGYYSGGTLALVAYGAPFEGEPVITVALFRNIPRFAFYDLLRSDAIGDMAHWMHLNTCNGLLERVYR